jgi:hypothetical protein
MIPFHTCSIPERTEKPALMLAKRLKVLLRGNLPAGEVVI